MWRTRVSMCDSDQPLTLAREFPARHHRYADTAEQLQQEAGIVLSKFIVADNIDLPFMLQQYEEYHEIKFSKRPVIVRRRGAPRSPPAARSDRRSPPLAPSMRR